MKLASLRDAKANLSAYVKLARDDVVVITLHGRPAAVLQGIEPEDLEEVIYEISPRFRKLIAARRAARGRAVPLAAARRRLLGNRKPVRR
ncbi:MAG: type II toxin-antitoxin system Phd/YefM family antitoxin [Planctomycetes bacterium]|jgi:prevent-host-death family protein|nr:type II toxin-antitoxin system Phd/YefM family antitoxin [Planctomycetota bacterium]